MIKLFLSDLDGTLLDGLLGINKADLEGIEKLKDNHIDFGIVTGRDLGFYFKYVKQYFNFDLDYIGNNGATLYVGNQKVYETHIEAKSAAEIISFLSPYMEHIYPFVADEECNFYYPIQKPNDDYWKEAQTHMEEIGPVGEVGLLQYLENPKYAVVKVSCWTKDADGSEYATLLRAQFREAYEISITAEHFVEVTAKGNDKGTTILKLMEHLNLQLDEIAVIGDGENDIPMLKLVPNAFVMRSAKDKVKQYGQVVDSVSQAIDIVMEGNND